MSTTIIPETPEHSVQASPQTSDAAIEVLTAAFGVQVSTGTTSENVEDCAASREAALNSTTAALKSHPKENGNEESSPANTKGKWVFVIDSNGEEEVESVSEMANRQSEESANPGQVPGADEPAGATRSQPKSFFYSQPVGNGWIHEISTENGQTRHEYKYKPTSRHHHHHHNHSRHRQSSRSKSRGGNGASMSREEFAAQLAELRSAFEELAAKVAPESSESSSESSISSNSSSTESEDNGNHQRGHRGFDYKKRRGHRGHKYGGKHGPSFKFKFDTPGGISGFPAPPPPPFMFPGFPFPSFAGSAFPTPPIPPHPPSHPSAPSAPSGPRGFPTPPNPPSFQSVPAGPPNFEPFVIRFG
ncbi:UNVERIFIED_CONTAM: hypothetical protein HDU68_001727 [Siphonaria sp. JEL0065]|nr:hypothetical protein HDU68_001727 [Siphonaria sp. JEL0065]